MVFVFDQGEEFFGYRQELMRLADMQIFSLRKIDFNFEKLILIGFRPDCTMEAIGANRQGRMERGQKTLERVRKCG